MIKNFLIMLNNLQQMHLKLLQKIHSKNSKRTSDLIGKKIANSITKFSKNSQQNNSEIVRNKHDKEIPKERQEIIDELRLKSCNIRK